MVGKTNVAGARLRAVIAVTYPEGSVCTCSNGTKTLKARDTSGKALFNVSTGTWTVTATDGNKTKDATVDITTEGQVESVTLKYSFDIIVNGKIDNAVIGSWTAGADSSGVGSLTEQDGYVQLYGPTPTYTNGSYTAWITTKALPTSEYETLHVDYEATFNGFSGVPFVTIGGVSVTNVSPTVDARNTRTADISNLNTDYQLQLIARVHSGEGHLSPVTINIYNLYLE